MARVRQNTTSEARNAEATLSHMQNMAKRCPSEANSWRNHGTLGTRQTYSMVHTSATNEGVGTPYQEDAWWRAWASQPARPLAGFHTPADMVKWHK